MTLKRITLVLLAILLMVLLARWFIGTTSHYANLPPGAEGPWIALGDSLTEGYGASEGHSYPAVLGNLLGIPIVNKGVSGDTTADGLKRLDDILLLKPRVVLLCLGGNDSLNQVPKQQTFANLAAIIERLHQSGTFVVLIGVRSASLRDKNETHFHRLAREQTVLYVPDILSGIAFKPIYMSDAIHPNDEGYERVAKRLEKILRPFLPKLQQPK